MYTDLVLPWGPRMDCRPTALGSWRHAIKWSCFPRKLDDTYNHVTSFVLSSSCPGVWASGAIQLCRKAASFVGDKSLEAPSWLPTGGDGWPLHKHLTIYPCVVGSHEKPQADDSVYMQHLLCFVCFISVTETFSQHLQWVTPVFNSASH